MEPTKENLITFIADLKDVIENSEDRWHQQESVFDHILSVFSALEGIIANNKKLEFLNEKIENHTRKEILETATLLHDIGKKEAMVKNNGFTTCKGHEEVGVKKAKALLDNFDFAEKEKERILKIIANHTEFHILLSSGGIAPNLEEIRSKFPDIWQELLLLAYADTKNSKVKEANFQDYEYRVNFYKKEIEKFIQDKK